MLEVHRGKVQVQADRSPIFCPVTVDCRKGEYIAAPLVFHGVGDNQAHELPAALMA